MPSASLLAAALDALDANAVIADADGRIAHADDAFCATVGVDRAGLVGTDIFERLVPEAERERARRTFDARFAGAGGEDAPPSTDAETDTAATSADGADGVPLETPGDAAYAVHWRETVRDDGEAFAVGHLRETSESESEADLGTAASVDPYRTLVEDAPVPIVVADDGGTICEVNAAAESLFGRASDALVGEPITVLHPTDDADAYAALFEASASGGGTRRYRPDGEQIYAVDDAGERTPVEISVTTVELDGETLVYGGFREITDQVWYETALEELHESAGELARAETDAAIAETVVETVAETLGMEFVSVYRFDAGAGMLYPLAWSDGVRDAIGEPPRLPLGESVAAEAYLEAEPRRLDDVRAHDNGVPADVAIRSELVVPIEGVGVVVCGHTDVGAFDPTEQRLLELLADSARAVFERTEREQELRRQRRTLETRTRELREAERLNADIREVVRIAVTAETQDELYQAACDRFGTRGPFAFAWIGEPNAEGDGLVPRAWAGDEQGYLETVSQSSVGDGDEPAARAVREGETTVVGNTARDVQDEPWRREALRRGFRSAIAVPLRHQGALYGVLAIYASEQRAVSDRMAAALEECGELLACVTNRMEWKHAILSADGTELCFRTGSQACPLLRIANERGCSFSFDGLREAEDGDTTVFVRLLDGSADQVETRAERSTGIASIRRIRDVDGGVLFQITFSEPFVATALADHGLRLERIVGGEGEHVRVWTTAPTTMPAHRAVEIVSSIYPDATLVSTSEPESDPASEPPSHGSVPDRSAARLLERLTDRQRETLELAYYGGYFESPKGLSGAEIAEQMGVSSSSFHSHLRAAQRRLFASLIGSRSDSI
ncbi:MAG: GAF domain-containing protein [Haloquadratum sp.]